MQNGGAYSFETWQSPNPSAFPTQKEEVFFSNFIQPSDMIDLQIKITNTAVFTFRYMNRQTVGQEVIWHVGKIQEMSYPFQLCMTANGFYIQIHAISNMYIITDKNKLFTFLAKYAAVHTQNYSTAMLCINFLHSLASWFF